MTLQNFITDVSNSELIAGTLYEVADADFCGQGYSITYWILAKSPNSWMKHCTIKESLTGGESGFEWDAVIRSNVYNNQIIIERISNNVDGGIYGGISYVNPTPENDNGYIDELFKLAQTNNFINVNFGRNILSNISDEAYMKNVLIRDGVNPTVLATDNIQNIIM